MKPREKKMMRDSDHFSWLPDNIITKIFSLLTMKESLGICISCKKLMHLRTTIPHLEFKESVDDSFNLSVDTKKRKLVEFIDQFLKNHDCPIKTFKLSFYPGRYSSNVLSWIGLVMQKGLIELDLNFLPNLGVPIQFPSNLLSSRTLKVLKLRSCILESPLGLSTLSSLKTVVLEDLTLSDDMIQELLRQSRLLENLVFENCKGFESINVTDVNSKLDFLSLKNCSRINYLFAPRVKVLNICNEKIDVFVLEPSEIKDLSIYGWPSKSGARSRTASVLGCMKFFADKEEERVWVWKYLGGAELMLETYSFNLGLLGHCWSLKSGCVEKFVISMITP